MDASTVLQEFLNGELMEREYVEEYHPFDISEYEYMRYALADLDSAKAKNSAGDLVNAVGNAKRAMHCRVDTILGFWGLLPLASKRPQWDFPKKLDNLEAAGVITPSLLRRLNKYRNKAEHEYEKPVLEHVEDFVDTVQLFLEATDKYLQLEVVGTSETHASIEVGFQERIEGRAIDRSPSPWLGAAREWVTLKLDREKAEISIDYCLPNADQYEKSKFSIKASEDLDSYLVALYAWNTLLLADSHSGLLKMRLPEEFTS